MTVNEVKKSFTLLLVGLAVFGYFLLCKIFLFYNLAYTSDMFSFLQMSRSLLEKGALLQENAFGGQLALHNFFLILCFFPLTIVMNASGLFIGLWALLLLAFNKLSGHLRPGILFMFFFCPVNYWLWDHPTYGWHLELVQFPVALFLASSLHEKKMHQTLFWAGLMILNKEDGAVLLGSVLLGHHIVTRGFKDHWLLLRKLALSLALFASGLALLKFNGATRTQSVLKLFFESLKEPGDLGYMVRNLIVCFLLCLSPFILVPKTLRLRASVALVLGFLPLFIIGIIAGRAYGPAEWVHGVLWPPRFVLIWGFTVTLLYFLFQQPTPEKMPGKKMVAFCAAIALFQISVLFYVRHYPFWERIVPFVFSEKLPAAALTQNEKEFFGCLARNLPSRFPIAVERILFSYFGRQDIVWPERLTYAWAAPEISICATPGRFEPKDRCRDPQDQFLSTYQTVEAAGWRIMSRPERSRFVEKCIEESRLR